MAGAMSRQAKAGDMSIQAPAREANRHKGRMTTIQRQDGEPAVPAIILLNRHAFLLVCLAAVLRLPPPSCCLRYERACRLAEAHAMMLPSVSGASTVSMMPTGNV